MLRQASIFGLVGITNTLVDFAVFATLIRLTDPVLANAIAWLTSFGCAYVGNSLFTFGAEFSRARLLRFFLTSLVALGTSTACVAYLAEPLGLWPAKIFAVAISYILGFALARSVAFR